MSKWGKTIYILLFGMLLLQPHILEGHGFFLPSPYLQSFVTLTIFNIAYLVYILHKRDITKKEKEKRKLSEEVLRQEEQLLDNYQYIGVLNRRMPLLQEITTELLSKQKITKSQKKEIFDRLLMLATISIAKAKSGVFRFVDSQTFHTVKEFQFISNPHKENFRKVSNKEIMYLLDKDTTHVADEVCIIGSSERDLPVKCAYIFLSSQTLEQDQKVILQAIVDQAQLLYSHLYLNTRKI